jgi:hypothetical protein
MAQTKEQREAWYRKHRQLCIDRVEFARLMDPERYAVQRREHRSVNRDNILMRQKLSYRRHGEKNRLKGREYAKKFYRSIVRPRQLAYLEAWKKVIPPFTFCQCCGIPVMFGGGDAKTSIHFDHRHGGIELIKAPTTWLGSHPCTAENRKIWLSCDFGILCRGCNSFLPTKGREEFLDNMVKYVRGRK